jgi:hypothetical protein
VRKLELKTIFKAIKFPLLFGILVSLASFFLIYFQLAPNFVTFSDAVFVGVSVFFWCLNAIIFSVAGYKVAKNYSGSYLDSCFGAIIVGLVSGFVFVLLSLLILIPMQDAAGVAVGEQSLIFPMAEEALLVLVAEAALAVAFGALAHFVASKQQEN